MPDPEPTRPAPGVWPRQLIEGPVPARREVTFSYTDLPHAPMSKAIAIVTANQAVPASQTPVYTRSVVVLAAPTNTGQIFVGGPETAFPLTPGAAIALRIRDLSGLYVMGTVGNDIVYVMAEVFYK